MSLLHARQIAISAVSILFIIASSNAQSNLRDKPISGSYGANMPLSITAMKLAADSGVPIGLETIRGRDNLSIDVNITEPTLGAELDRIVRTDSQYEWKQSGRMINIFPKDEQKSVFDVAIGHFEMKNSLPVQMVQELFRVSTVASYLTEHKLRAATWVTGSASRDVASLTLNNTTLRQALNSVALESNRLGWIAFYMQQQGHEYIYVQLR